MFNNQSYFQFI